MILSTTLVSHAALAGYTAVDLYPLVGPAGFPNASAPDQASTGSVVGSAADQGEFHQHAVLWRANGAPVDLTPSAFLYGEAFAADGLRQVGAGTPFPPPGGSASGHALLWVGTADSVTDLSPAGFVSSAAFGVGGGQQVGAGTPANGSFQHALVWAGTAASAIDLNSTGLNFSQAKGTNGTQQVGYGGGPATNGYRHALLWTGTADSVVDLNPTDLPGITDSSANATNGRQQVGEGTGGQGHSDALLWNGTADSAVDLQPSGFQESHALGLNDTSQVGWGLSIVATGSHALVWSGTADSVVDLHLLLPSQFAASIAYTIDAAGDVFGTAFNPSDHHIHAIEWLPHAVTPGDANLDGTVDFTDLLALAQHYGQSGGWVNGDFNDDRIVNFADLLALAQNYGQSTPSAVGSVPEPASAATVALAALILRRRRSAGEPPRAC